MFGRSRLQLKTRDGIVAMRRAGLVTGSALCAAARATEPGMTTAQVDRVAFDHMKEAGATPSFLGYNGFPATLCISVNDEVVHGIPGARVLHDGDVVSLDCGAIVDGWHGDSALTFVVGAPTSSPVSGEAVAARHEGAALSGPDDLKRARESVEGDHTSELILATEESMRRGIFAVRHQERLNSVGAAIENYLRVKFDAERAGGGAADAPEFEIVDGYTGHGVGRELHMDPTVYNEAVRERLPKIQPGLVIAIEPMVTLGTYETHELEDGWTVKTDDGSLAAHFEHTVAVTENGLWVLTAADGGQSWLGARYGALQ